MAIGCEQHNIKEAIRDSERLLNLEEDWDDCGGLPIKEETLERANNFIPKFDEWLANRERIEKEAKRMGMRPDMI